MYKHPEPGQEICPRPPAGVLRPRRVTIAYLVATGASVAILVLIGAVFGTFENPLTGGGGTRTQQLYYPALLAGFAAFRAGNGSRVARGFAVVLAVLSLIAYYNVAVGGFDAGRPVPAVAFVTLAVIEAGGVAFLFGGAASKYFAVAGEAGKGPPPGSPGRSGPRSA